MAMLKNPYLRLLMTTVGIRRLTPLIDETLESLWTVPPEITADQLKEYTKLINEAEFSPPMFEEGGAEDQLRRKVNRSRRAVESSDEEDGDLDNLFAAGGPTNRKAVDGEKKKKSTRRRKKRSQSPDDAELDERARKRQEKEREKRAKVKSEMYIYDSDGDSDADREFFAREEELRRSNQQVAEKAGQSIPGIVPFGTKPFGKRKKTVLAGDSGDEMGLSQDLESDGEGSGSGSGSDSGSESGSGSDESGSESGSGRSSRKRRRVSVEPLGAGADDGDDLAWPGTGEKEPVDGIDGDGDVGMGNTEAEADPGTEAGGDEAGDEEDDEPVPSARPRPRVRGGFVLDSSDEE